jgi:major vault protein
MHNVNLLGESYDPDVAVATKGLTPSRRGLRGKKNLLSSSARSYGSRGIVADTADGTWADEEVGTDLVGDDFSRGTAYTPPREVSLNTKYDGAVAVSVWNGYAVLLVSKSGNRRVVVGPQQVLLEYDETPEVLTLSTGKPKNTDDLKRTAYLRAKHNKVSDVVFVETSDLVSVSLKLSYRVNFIGDDPIKWFAVENYVKFLCDHLRSRLRNIAKNYGIEEFHQNAIDIVRDTILGMSSEGEKRDGLIFDENAMQVYDVEVLNISIGDRDIGDMLQKAQHRVVSQALQLKQARQEEHLVREREEIERRISEYQTDTKILKQGLTIAEEKKNQDVALTIRASQQAQMEAEQTICQAQVVRDKIRSDYEQAVRSVELNINIKENDADVKGQVARLKAIQPDLIAAIEANGQRETLREVIKHMGPMHLIGTENITDALSKILAGTPLANVLSNGNGEAKHKNIPRRTRPASESRVEE